MPTKTKKTRLEDLKGRPKVNRRIIFGIVAVIAVIGAILIAFSKAAPNNCQQENSVSICDVDAVWGVSDTVMSTGPQAQDMGNQGWGWYMGAVFRAPTTAYQGAVPVHSVSNGQYTWREYVTDTQKRDKEAKYGPLTYEGVAFFAWENPGVPNTVPVYRLTQGGAGSKSIFTTDKAWVDLKIAEGKGDPNGWKSGETMPAIAFYAYPPNYKVANQPNPYDCSLQENFVTDNCKGPREALAKQVDAGNIPASNDCPKTLDVYRKAPFPGQFSADCQKFWNAYMQDCQIVENFTSDRCKTQREALAKAQAEQAAQRAAAQAAALKAGNSGGGSTKTKTPKTTPTSTVPNCATADGQKTDYCKNFFNAVRTNKLLADAAQNFSSSEPKKSSGILWTGLNAYVCHISGEKRGKSVNNTLDSPTYWYKFGMNRTYLAVDAGDAKQQCIAWRTQTNNLDDYRGFTITSVTKK